MENLVTGVFSPSTDLGSASMINCLQSLFHNHPLINFISVNSDEKLQGFRVCFSQPELLSTVVKKNQLTTTTSIYPLTTYIMIHDIGPKKTSMFDRDLRDAINKRIGKVIEVIKHNTSPNYVDWRVEIDIPEFKELSVFESGSLSKMTISLPDRGETFNISFWCRYCKLSGHFHHECGQRRKTGTNSNTPVNGKTGEKQKEDDQSLKNIRIQSSPRSDAPSDEFSNFIPLEPTERYAEKIGREEILKTGILSDENGKLKKTETSRNTPDVGAAKNSNLLTDREIKREGEEFEARSDRREESTENKKHDVSKSDKPGNSSTLKYDGDGSNHSDITASTDEEIQIIGFSNKNTPVKSPSHDSNFSVKAETSNPEEASRSPTETRNTNYSFTFPATAGPSNEFLSTPRPRGAEVTTALSERLQDCINDVCDTVRVLDRQTLDAFLIHVKKKSNPIRVALNYTANAKGLKGQLQKILDVYYKTPQTGTKEDIQFIKWLNGLVERFDGTIPRKRKRGGQSNDEPSSKK